MATVESPRVGEDGASRRDRRMPLGEHLREFRRRFIIGILALVVGMIVAFVFTDQIIWAMTEPIRVVAEQRGKDDVVTLMYQSITGPFDMRLRISLAVGIIISAPVWLWQLWAFLMPGLTRKEIKYTVGFVAAAIPLFATGVFVGWLIMPHIVELMASFTPQGASNIYDSRYYYDFVFKLLFVVGVSFVLPVFLVALNLAGVMSGMAILKGWRVAILVASVFAALATPAADIVSMLMLAGILTVLFFAAAGLSVLFDRRRAKREKVLGLNL